jgi:hypothetical protein
MENGCLVDGSQFRSQTPNRNLGCIEVRLRVTLRPTVIQSVSQYILVSSPICGRSTRYCFLFKSLRQEFVVLSLWGALSDERPGLSFVEELKLFVELLVRCELREDRRKGPDKERS